MVHPKLGKYRHFKTKKTYEIVGVGRYSGYNKELDLEEMVIYRALYNSELGENVIWVRPLKMFMETVEWEGQKVPRFEYLTNNDK